MQAYMALFTDSSLDPDNKVGVGSCLFMPLSFLMDGGVGKTEMTGLLKIKRFEETSSAALEIRTVLWAVEAYKKKMPGMKQLKIYSDSQCVAGLRKRRPGLEATGFLSKRTNRLLRNALLYQRFYELHDELGFEIIKLKGHTPVRCRDTIHGIFSFVDKETRKALRLWIKDIKKPQGESSD